MKFQNTSDREDAKYLQGKKERKKRGEGGRRGGSESDYPYLKSSIGKKNKSLQIPGELVPSRILYLDTFKKT